MQLLEKYNYNESCMLRPLRMALIWDNLVKLRTKENDDAENVSNLGVNSYLSAVLGIAQLYGDLKFNISLRPLVGWK